MSVKDYAVGIEIAGEEGHSSTGYLFNSECNSKTFILTSKHSICIERAECEKINTLDNCRECELKFDLDKISIKCCERGVTLVGVNISTRTDTSLIEVQKIAGIPGLSQTNQQADDYSVWYNLGEKRYVLNKPDIPKKGLIKFNIESNVSANLKPKSKEFAGVSGGLIFKKIDQNYYAEAILTEDGGGNDVGAELLDDSLVNELNELSQTNLFNKDRSSIYEQLEKENVSNVVRGTNGGTLFNLIEKSKQLSKEDPDYKNMLDELSEFLAARPGRKIIGLENKLIEGDRQDLFWDAEFLSNKFARRVSKGQFSTTDEIVFFHCLSIINSNFKHSISPAIKNGEQDNIVDEKILKLIVLPLYNEVSEFVVSISPEMIRGMLFYLTGKCHIRWNK